jgi:Mrp family chromosome partitioning ATPase/predicted Fe-Mo cluster-binding NifX family protein
MSKPNPENRAARAKSTDFSVAENPLNHIRRSIAIISGKGGVGKSLVTSLLATYLRRGGEYRVGILDADITGPSIPKLLGVDKARPQTTELGVFPARSHSDIQVMSINLLLDEPEAPVVWRGPILANTVKQFWTDVIWGDLDFMFLDMPPGTGDVPLTVFQSIPLSGIIIVTSPQDLVAMIVKKAVNMARMMNIPIIGIIENMSYAVCPHCGETIRLFGESTTEAIARKWDVPFLGSLPIDPDLTRLCDTGHIEKISKLYLQEAVAALKQLPARDGAAEETAAEPGGGSSENDVAASATAPQSPRLVAVATDNGTVAQHFGHCQGLTIYKIQDGRVSGEEFLANPGHQHGLLPNMLREKGVTTLIAGGMGQGAIDICKAHHIETITGAAGLLSTVMAQYLAGGLESSDSVCEKHEHASDCGHDNHHDHHDHAGHHDHK